MVADLVWSGAEVLPVFNISARDVVVFVVMWGGVVGVSVWR